jgi:general secretion pathway protein M
LELSRLKESLVQYLSSISDRERRIILLGFPVLLVALYITVVFIPILGAKESYQNKSEKLIKKVEALKPRIEELLTLKSRIEPLLEKVKRGSELDAASYVKTVARMVGLELKEVKLLPGKVQNGIEVDIISVNFKEQPLNRLTRFLFKLETSRYYFKSDGIKISDYDENGLVSGKVSLYFFRRVK